MTSASREILNDIQLRQLGNTDLRISSIAFGTRSIGGDYHGEVADRDARGALEAAIAAGVNTFDVAEHYGAGRSERLLGAALRSAAVDGLDAVILGRVRSKDQSGRPRKPEEISDEVQRSRERLGRAIDVLTIEVNDNPLLRPDETAELSTRLKEMGVASHFGIATDSVAMARAVLKSLQRFELIQMPFNVLGLLNPGVSPAVLADRCARDSVSFLAYDTLGGGLLTGRHNVKGVFGLGDIRATWASEVIERTTAIAGNLGELARDGEPLARALVRSVLSQPFVTAALVGMKSRDQVREICS